MCVKRHGPSQKRYCELVYVVTAPFLGFDSDFGSKGRSPSLQLRRNIQGALTVPLKAQSGKLNVKQASAPESGSPTPPSKISTDDAFRQKYRPQSGAEAFLVLERDYRLRESRRVPELPRSRRYEKAGIGARMAQRGSRTRMNEPQPWLLDQASRSVIDLRKLGDFKTGKTSFDTSKSLRTDRSVLPGSTSDSSVTKGETYLLSRNLKDKKSRRVSKALPAIPQRQSRHGPASKLEVLPDVPESIDIQLPRPTNLQDVKPSAPIQYRSSTSSLSTYDSAGLTWDLVDKLMHAVGEDEVRRARMEFRGHGGNGDLKARGSVIFPCKGTSGTTDVDLEALPPSSELRLQRGRRDGFQDTTIYDRPPYIDRSLSDVSDFSVVIQPANSSDSHTRDDEFVYVSEEDFPARIKHVLQQPRTFDLQRNATLFHEHDFHDDLLLTIKALQEVECNGIDGVNFDKDED